MNEPKPLLFWPSDVKNPGLHPDLRWLICNQRSIVEQAKARPMKRPRPIVLYRSGRVRIEWVGTYESLAAAREAWEVLG